MNDLELENKNKGFMKSTYGDNKMDKSNELNESMTISPSPQDEYTRTIHNIGGSK